MDNPMNLIQVPHVDYKCYTHKEPGVQVIRLFDTHFEVQGKAHTEEKENEDADPKEVNYDYLYFISKEKIVQIEAGYHTWREIYEVSVYISNSGNAACNFPCIDRKSAFELYKKLKTWWLT